MQFVVATLRGKIVITFIGEKRFEAELTPQEARRLVVGVGQRVEQLRPSRKRKRRKK